MVLKCNEYAYLNIYFFCQYCTDQGKQTIAYFCIKCPRTIASKGSHPKIPSNSPPSSWSTTAYPSRLNDIHVLGYSSTHTHTRYPRNGLHPCKGGGWGVQCGLSVLCAQRTKGYRFLLTVPYSNCLEYGHCFMVMFGGLCNFQFSQCSVVCKLCKVLKM